MEVISPEDWNGIEQLLLDHYVPPEVPVLFPRITGHWTRRMDRRDCLFQQRHCVVESATTVKNSGYHSFPVFSAGDNSMQESRSTTGGRRILVITGEWITEKEKAHPHY